MVTAKNVENMNRRKYKLDGARAPPTPPTVSYQSIII